MIILFCVLRNLEISCNLFCVPELLDIVSISYPPFLLILLLKSNAHAHQLTLIFCSKNLITLAMGGKNTERSWKNFVVIGKWLGVIFPPQGNSSSAILKSKLYSGSSCWDELIVVPHSKMIKAWSLVARYKSPCLINLMEIRVIALYLASNKSEFSFETLLHFHLLAFFFFFFVDPDNLDHIH